MTGGNLRTRRSGFNFATGLLGTACSLAIAFVTTPLILRWLGTERFGALRAAADWFGHLSLLELGLGGALAPLIALALGRGDTAAVRRTLAEGIRAYTRVAVMAILAGAIVTVFITRLVPVSPALAPDLRRACLVALVALLLYPLAPFRNFADAAQRGYVVNLTNLAQGLLTTTLAVLLAWRGFGITGQFVALLAGQTLFLTLMARDGLRREPGLLRAALREPRDAGTRAQIRRLNFATFLFDLAGRAGLLTDNIVIAMVLGPVNVAPLFLTQRLAAMAQLQIQGVGNASWAALGELHAMGRHDVFAARLLQLTRLVAALGMATLVPIAAHNHAFVVLWVGDAHYGGDLVTVFAAVNGFLLALVSLWGWCFSGTGQVAAMVPVMLIAAVINLGASIAGAYAIGLAGPLIGTCVGVASTTLWYLPAQLQRRFGVPAAALARAALGPVVWAALPSAAIVWLAIRYPPAGWVALAARMAASGLVLLAVWWFGELSGEERAHYRERIALVLPARR